MTNDRVLVDYRTADDAGVYKLDEERALVQTVDFFTPIVDEPFVYGQIAAANALSDVYAMGGRPLTALAIAGFPKELDAAILTEIFAGGLDTLQRAGVSLMGGHTVQDQEIKFGYAVTGEIHPLRIWTNAGARAGDELLLTKPLGTGVIATALKAGRAPEGALRAAVESMSRLNRGASEALQSLPAGAVQACTAPTSPVSAWPATAPSSRSPAASRLKSRPRRFRCSRARCRWRRVILPAAGARMSSISAPTSTCGQASPPIWSPSFTIPRPQVDCWSRSMALRRRRPWPR